ncbi:MAG: PD-(D/E)XK nuclease family transposase [Deltaproteobacteria bacterium]|nr:PD-(D/E)XK nuclease family transposase [Deltaproteobacteria bacterium]
MTDLITEGKYIDFFTDFGFKKLFGPLFSEILIDFLNAVLDGFEESITDLEYIDKEKLVHTPQDRIAIFDLYCVTGDGKRIIIELQNIKQKEFFGKMHVLHLSRVI